MFHVIKKSLASAALLGMSFAAEAAAPTWKIDPTKSDITFVATENNIEVMSKFTKFTGDIKFDPAQLDSSSVSITIEMASVQSKNPDVMKHLSSTEWFDTKQFPKATFKSSKIINTSGNAYEAQGELTIRDKTVPVTLRFMLDDYVKERAVVTGTADIKRTDFNVGTGEWAKTDTVKDEVRVNFKVTATPAGK